MRELLRKLEARLKKVETDLAAADDDVTLQVGLLHRQEELEFVIGDLREAIRRDSAFPRSKAYLIVIYERETNVVRRAAIWSSPEWEQSRTIPGCHAYVAYFVASTSFHEARKILIQDIERPISPYHWLWKLLEEADRR